MHDVDFLLLDQGVRVADAGQDLFFGEVWVALGDDLFRGEAVAQEPQDDLDRDAGAGNPGFAVAGVGIHLDALSDLHRSTGLIVASGGKGGQSVRCPLPSTKRSTVDRFIGWMFSRKPLNRPLMVLSTEPEARSRPSRQTLVVHRLHRTPRVQRGLRAGIRSHRLLFSRFRWRSTPSDRRSYGFPYPLTLVVVYTGGCGRTKP